MAHLKGVDKVLANLNKEIGKIEGRSKAGLLKAGLELQAESIKEAPVMDGFLRNSCYIASDIKSRGMVVYVGYHAVYAARTHENPRSGKTGGVSPSGYRYKKWAKVGKWKFLEDPLKRLASRMLGIIRKSARIRR
jgi:hypothetical protein